MNIFQAHGAVREKETIGDACAQMPIAKNLICSNGTNFKLGCNKLELFIQYRQALD